MSLLEELENSMGGESINEESWADKRERKAEAALDAILNAVGDPKVKEALFALKAFTQGESYKASTTHHTGGPSVNNMDGRTSPSNQY